MTMDKKIPKTKEECFAQLDEMLSEEEKKALMENDDLFDYHFTLGLWIRNNWIYPLNRIDEKTFMEMFVEDKRSLLFIHPDSMSSVIIEKYVEYLNGKEWGGILFSKNNNCMLAYENEYLNGNIINTKIIF